MLTIWRSLLIFSLPLIGFAVATLSGRLLLAPEGQGLADAITALGYGLFGALALLLIAVVLAFKLSSVTLRNYALVCTLLATVIYGTLIYRATAKSTANREPDSAFIHAGNFTAVMQRLDTSDPYLFVKMEVNSTTRSWRMTGPAPQHRTCSSQMNAQKLIDIRTSLDKLGAASAGNLDHCQRDERAIKRLRWSIDGVSNSLDISTNCVQANDVVGRALAMIEGASNTSSSPVKCD